MAVAFHPGDPRALLAAAALICTVLGPTVAAAQDLPVAAQNPQPSTPSANPAPADRPWYRRLSFNGFASLSYTYNFNRPPDGRNTYRVFDINHNQLTFDAAELVVQKSASKAGEAGFRFDAMVGSGIPPATEPYGLFRDEDGTGHNYDIHQAYLSYIVPVGRGLRLDGGRFITPVAYEVIDGHDGYNDNFSRSFEFGYAVPFTHTGLKVGYPFSDRVSGTLLVCKGWDTFEDNNDSITLGGQVTAALHPRVTLSAGYLRGPEQPDNDTDVRALWDVVATSKITNRLTAALNLDFGSEQNAPIEGGFGDASWHAAAAYLRYAFLPTFSLAFRAERFADPLGARTGVGQTLSEFTVTPEVKFHSHFVLRADIRVDHSTELVFQTRSGPAGHQATIGLNAIAFF